MKQAQGITHELRAGEEAVLVDAMTGDYRASFYAVARQRVVVPYGLRLETCAAGNGKIVASKELPRRCYEQPEA